MLKLMKYEFRKTAFSKVILLLITAVLEVAFLLGVFLKNDRLLAVGIVLLMLCTVMGILYTGLNSVITLHRDLNTKQSYMLFLTPKSSYEILGAKILENGISIVLTGIFFAALAVIDFSVAIFYIGGLKELWDMVKSFIDVSLNMAFSPKEIGFYFFSALASWIVYIVNADLAVILSSSVLAGKKCSGLLSLVFFIILSTALGMILDWIPVLKNADLAFVLYIVVSLAISAGLYLVSGWIMEKKLSV